MTPFAHITNSRECWAAGARLHRHRHDQAYAAIVLSGCYEECGSLGRFCVGPGDVVFHGRFEAHLDRFGAKGAQILNLVAVESASALPSGVCHAPDADAVARIAETDATAAWLQLREQIAPVATSPAGWAEMLAADLVGNPQWSLGDWARAQRLAPETLSRGFQKLFGVTPAAFRAETRARKAFARIVSGAESLAAIAAASGFADQAHMSRATKALTGKTPGHWRASSNSFKTRTTLPG